MPQTKSVFEISVLFASLILPAIPASAQSITAAAGITVSVDASGSYDLAAPNLAWHFHGIVGYPLSNIATASGADSVGSYSEIDFDFQSDAARHAYIRAYGNRAAVLFSVTNPSSAAPNSFAFPNWSQYPQNLSRLSYAGIFAPPSFNNLSNEGPWVLFDSSANTLILSPASSFMVAGTTLGPNGELASGISSKIASLPQSFQQSALLVIEPGTNRAFDTWGQVMTDLHGKVRPANDADTSLNLVGYWTDNGATYYYNTADSSSYEQTLSAIKAEFDSIGIGLGYIQLDSWFYPKGPGASWSANGSGIYQYTAAPALFPDSLASFQQQLGVSLVTHARWIDPSSPYHQLYQMSGSVVTDPQYWDSVAGYLSASGVGTYEQDWLDDKAQTSFDLPDPEAFLGNMASALNRHNITVQYCMAGPRHFLQTVRYSNVTSIRVSADRMTRDRWSDFLFTSRLASALGVWPFTDAFLSTEPANLLLATLSAGPVGIGDPIGAISAPNLAQAVRADGVIVKPDVPLVPMDGSYGNAAQGVDAPIVAFTYTDFGRLRPYYLFAFASGSNNQVTLHPSDFGASQSVYLYNYLNGTGQVAESSEAVTWNITGDALYVIAAPIGPSGMAILGDLGNYASLGRKRITSLTDNGAIHVSVAFAAGEKSRVVTGYAPEEPAVKATAGAIGAVSFDPASHRFQITVEPGADGTAALRLHQWRHTGAHAPHPSAE